MNKPKMVKKTIREINDRISNGKAVVLTAREMIDAVKSMGKVVAAREVDVVTTGTFSPMCSSGLLFNMGQPEPPLIKASKVWLNDVPAYGGLAAVDAFLGATEPSDDDPLNKVYPGRFNYGGGHVIEDLLKGEKIRLRALGYGTDCYPRRTLEREYALEDFRSAELLNPRNAYQNYNCAVNFSDKLIYTYMGPLKPRCANANYATSGALSPLFNDPFFRTIGLGTKIFLGGGIGWVIGAGTQHNPKPQRTERGLPLTPSGTLMVKGNLKGMQSRYLRGVSFLGYGCSLSVGVGVPIPILDEEMAWFTGVSDADIMIPVVDYGHDYPNGVARNHGHISYAELRSGTIRVGERETATVPLTSYTLSLEIAQTLKQWIESGKFTLGEAQEHILSE
ncbi:homocysteine biosynthesis protein [Desulfonatronum thioautotrophicum]|uniref:homocysteine biosynthesis protein n=1 Tax=Desulfonatronum thioautotrophicum TaxID=617001 RepID=UPI0005EAE12B|nr:homocysteine biosynthesis protein [Desulfonatronum thioautotrophicum]